MNNPPLVSIVVITYNSSRFIIETLDSILNQDYKNLELIISDDSSSDNTLEIIKEWISENNYRFKRVILLESSTNEGITKNITTGCKEAKGKWVKPMAGDDILLPNAISKYVFFAEKNNSKIVYSNVKKIINNVISNDVYPQNHTLINKTSKEQYLELLNGANFYSPTEFYSKRFLEKNNYFDNKYRNIEDFPFLLKITKSGTSIDFINDVLLLYRISNNSVSNNSERTDNFININYNKDLQLIYKDLVFPETNISNLIHHIDKKIQFTRNNLTIALGNSYIAYKYLGILNFFNPKYYLIKLKIIKPE